jgi:hypothetical protein
MGFDFSTERVAAVRRDREIRALLLMSRRFSGSCGP